MSQVRRRELLSLPIMPAGLRGIGNWFRCWAQHPPNKLSLRRWMTRLKRAFNTVDRLHTRIARLERQLAG